MYNICPLFERLSARLYKSVDHAAVTSGFVKSVTKYAIPWTKVNIKQDISRTEEDGACQQKVTVWFDAQCPLCVREIELMRRLDKSGAIEFVDVHGAGSCPIDRSLLLTRFHARDEDGRLVSGAEAFAAMWRAIPLMRPLGLAARWRPLLATLEFLYLGFLRIRPSLQRLVKRMQKA